MDNHEQFTRRWTEAQPIVAGYINAVVPDFQEAEDLLQDVAVILLRQSTLARSASVRHGRASASSPMRPSW